MAMRIYLAQGAQNFVDGFLLIRKIGIDGAGAMAGRRGSRDLPGATFHED